MYLSILAIIVIGVVVYLIGFNKGKEVGRMEMQDHLIANPDLYGRLKYEDDRLNEDFEDD